MTSVVTPATFSANIRLSTVPGLTQKQYDSLIDGNETPVEHETALYLVKYGFCTTPAGIQDQKPLKKKKGT